MMAVGGFAQEKAKPKTLKELVAEEKAQKEAAKAAREASRPQDKPADRPASPDGVQSTDQVTPENAADYVTETDTAIWAPTKVKQLGAQTCAYLSSRQTPACRDNFADLHLYPIGRSQQAPVQGDVVLI